MKLHMKHLLSLAFSISPQWAGIRTFLCVLRLQWKVLFRDLLFAMEQHPCNKWGCRTGNLTEVCKSTSGVKMVNRGRLFTISSDVQYYQPPREASEGQLQNTTNVTLHQHVACVVASPIWKILHGLHRRQDKWLLMVRQLTLDSGNTLIWKELDE